MFKIIPLNNKDYDFIRITEKSNKKNYTHSFHRIRSVA